MKEFYIGFGMLLAALVIIFWPAIKEDKVAFSNDGPLGSVVAAPAKPPGTATEVWNDQNWIGLQAPPHPLSVSTSFRTFLFMPYKIKLPAVLCGATAIYFLLRKKSRFFVLNVVLYGSVTTLLAILVAFIFKLADPQKEDSVLMQIAMLIVGAFPFMMIATLLIHPDLTPAERNPDYKP